MKCGFRCLNYHYHHHLLLLVLLVIIPIKLLGAKEESEIVITSTSKYSLQREFDYFMLALQWPGTICQRTRHCCPSNGCCSNYSSSTEFTIHGLWPNYNDGIWPACCSQSHFDVKKISPLIRMLRRYWPSLSCSSSSLCSHGRGLLWGHEWEKHGTCSYPIIRDEYSYFSTVLDLYLKYNITKILNDAGFPPSNENEYPLADIVSTIKEKVGASPLLVCKHGSVEELRICFTKDFKPQDCSSFGFKVQTDKLDYTKWCHGYISIPEYTPLMLEDDNATLTWLPQTGVF